MRAIGLVSGRPSISEGEEVYLVAFEGVGGRDAAELLAGSTLYIRASDRPALRDEDEFYVQDLVGLKVRAGGAYLARCSLTLRDP